MPLRTPRLNRLLAKSGKGFAIAVDHGTANDAALLEGIEDMPKAVATLAEAGPDALLLTVGQAQTLQDLPGRQKPSLILRADISNVYSGKREISYWCAMIGDPVEQALRLDAACVILNLFSLPDQPDLHGECIENIHRIRPACDRFGMPLMIEPLVMKPASAGGYAHDPDADKVVALVRLARELGADVIKADPCEPTSRYHEIVRAAGCPVLPRGGGKVSLQEIFQRTYELLRQGASGAVYGRNVSQHPNPAAMTRAFMALIHENATPEQALRHVEPKRSQEAR